MSSVRFFLEFAGAFPKRTILMIVLLVLSSFAEGLGIVSLLPLLQLAQGEGGNAGPGRIVIELLTAVGFDPGVPHVLVLIVLLISVKSLFLWLAMRLVGFTIAHVTAHLRLSLIERLLGAKWRYFADRPKGQLANAINSEVQRASGSYMEACQFLASVIEAAIYAAVAFAISWQITLFALGTGALFVVALRKFIGASRSAGQAQTELMRSLSARLVDVLHSIKPIRAMALERHLLPLLRRETEGLHRAQQQMVLAVQTLRLFQEPMIAAMLALGLFALLTVDNQPLSGVLVIAFVFYRLLGRIHTLQQRYQGIVHGESAYWSLQQEIAAAEAEQEGDDAQVPPPPLRRHILLDNVSFGYGDVPILSDLTLTIPRGRFVAIVGASGTGKTTAVDLILGLHQPQRGDILIDDTPLRTVDLQEWRRQIGYVPQDTLLFHDTIYRNVTLGDDQIPREQVEWALRAAGAWDFVAQRELGLDDMVGEQGTKLSGGQRQRIAIARALVRRPQLLILDEATTALDPVTETAICETLRGLGGTVTIVAISHQPALRAVADVVYVLENGRVREIEDRSSDSESLLRPVMAET